MSRQVHLKYEPRKPFIPFHNSNKRWSCLVIHRRAGKTVATINDLIISALTNQKQRPQYAYIAPYFHQAKRVAWDYLKFYAEPFLSGKPNESELRVDLIGGRRISLYGADNADSLRGIYLDGAILDEFGDFKPSVWGNVLRPALSDRQGWACFCGTPKGRNEFWQIREQARRHPDDWYFLELRASDSGLINEKELEQARRQLTPEQFAQEYECDFAAALPGAYFGRELVEAERKGRIRSVEADENLPVYTAWDIGYRDDTAIWWYQVVRDEIHVIDYHASSGQTIDFYAKLITDKPYRYACHWLPHDAKAKTLASGGKSIIEQLAHHLGLDKLAIVPHLDVQDGIQAARLAIGRAWFDEARCTEGLEALRQYQREYDEDKKAFREKPRHDWTCFTQDAEVLTRYGTCQIMKLPENGEVLTPCGWKKYQGPRLTRLNAQLVEVAFSDGHTVKCTPEHLFLTDSGWKSAQSLTPGLSIRSSLTPLRSISMVVYTVFGRVKDTLREAARSFTERLGGWHSEISRQIATFITETRIQPIISYQISNACLSASIFPRLQRIVIETIRDRSRKTRETKLLNGTSQRPDCCGIAGMRSASRNGLYGRVRTSLVSIVGLFSRRLSGLGQPRRSSVQKFAASLTIASVRPLQERADVCCIHVPDGGWFSLANGAVVHNSHPSDAFRMLAVAWRAEEKPEVKPEQRSIVVGAKSTYTIQDAWDDAAQVHSKVVRY